MRRTTAREGRSDQSQEAQGTHNSTPSMRPTPRNGGWSASVTVDRTAEAFDFTDSLDSRGSSGKTEIDRWGDRATWEAVADWGKPLIPLSAPVELNLCVVSNRAIATPRPLHTTAKVRRTITLQRSLRDSPSGGRWTTKRFSRSGTWASSTELLGPAFHVAKEIPESRRSGTTVGSS